MTTSDASPFAWARTYHSKVEQQKHIAQETAGSLPIRSAQMVNLLGPDYRVQYVAAVYIDASKRPDVRDLYRIHGLEGGGETRSGWHFAMVAKNPLAILNTYWTSPARCHVRLVFPIRKHRAFLDQVAAIEEIHLLFHTTPPIETLGLECECDSLRAALTMIDQLDGKR